MRSVSIDLFRWAVGLSEVCIAILLLLVPSQLLSPVYDYIRPHAGLYGALFLVAGGQLVTLAATRPVVDRRPGIVSHAFSAIPLFYLAYGYLVTGSYPGAVVNLALGLGCVVGPFLVRRFVPSAPSVTGDVLFYAIGLALLADGCLIWIAPSHVAPALGEAFAPSLGLVGAGFVVGGLLLLGAHVMPKAPYWLVGVSHMVAAMALAVFLASSPNAETPGIALVSYGLLDVFLLASPFFYSRPGLLRSDTLAVRLSALIALIAAVPLIYLSIVTAANVRSALQAHVAADQLVLARVAAHRLSDTLAASQREVDALGDIEGIRSMDPSAQRDLLREVQLALPQFTVLATCDLDGYEIARSDERPLGYVGDRDFFQTARSGHVTWQFWSSSSGQQLITFAAPIRGSDRRVSGVLTGSLIAASLASTIDQNVFQSGSWVLLLDDSGKVIAQSGNHGAESVTSVPGLSPTDGTMLLSLAGQRYLSGVSTVTPQGWRIVVAVPESDAIASIDRVQKVTLVTFMVALAGVLVAAGAVARLLARPITELTAAAEALARGDDRAPLPTRAGGEVGVLAKSFGSMRATLRAHEAALVARERRARGVAAVMVALGHAHGFENALRALCRELQIVLESRFCAAYLAEGGALVARGVDDVDPRFVELAEIRVRTDSPSLLSDVFRSGVPVLVTDARTDTRIDRALVERVGIQAALAVPITVGGERRGVLFAVDADRSVRFTMPDLDLTRAVVSTADLVLDNAFLDEESDRRRAEAERLADINADLYAAERETADALRESQSEMERFVYTVSHDLRAPLVTIQGFTHRVLQGYGEVLDERGRDYLQRIQRNAQRLEMLINDLLQLSRIGRTDLEVEPISLPDLVDDVRGQLAVQLENKGIDLVVPGNLPTVMANRHRLGQVLENLVENAILYMGNRFDSRKPTIGVGVVEEAEGWRVWVSDNGTGIPPEHRERIFNVFERLSAGKVAHPEGTGIGLATVRKIVETHGGQVWVEETPGGGATICFTIGRVSTANTRIEEAPRMAMAVEQASDG